MAILLTKLSRIFRSLVLMSCALSMDELASVANEIDAPTTIDFNEHIRPIFTAHCTACHGGVQQAGDVSFAYRDQVLPPNGWIVEPGNPDDSILIERVISKDPDERMPPPDHGPALSSRDIDLLREWIRQGAKWSEHWAFEKPKHSSVPVVTQSDWQRQPMDNFVLAKLEANGIEPSPDELPERWLRRVTLDLTGLPPSPENREAFLRDVDIDAEAAYESVVDRLLGSPAYGHRWASVWLDQVRYADSKGLGLDGRRNIWKYRDWVIDAFNRDLPYDEFTVKQIAGDLLPEPSIEDVVATAAHRLTQSNEEGGTDDEEFRIAAVLDRVNTTWQTWQGVTFGCVQCHSHPYDPFRHEEYYKFAAFFNNSADCDLDEDWPVIQAPIDPSQYEDASKLDHQIERLRDDLWEHEYRLLGDAKAWQPLVDMKASSNNATKLVVERIGNHDEFHTEGTVSRDADFTLEAPLPEKLASLTAIRLTAMPLNPATALPDSEWGFVIAHIEANLIVPGDETPRAIPIARLIIDEPQPFYDPQESLNEKSNRGFAAYSRIHHPRQAGLVLQEPIDIPKGSRLEIKLKHRTFILAAFSLITQRGCLDVSDDVRFTELLLDDELRDKRDQLAGLEKDRSAIKSTSVPILRERPDHLSRPTHVFIRGLFLTKDEQVTPGTPESLPPLPENLAPNRLALAKWLVSPENPLTARVAVNRLWAQLFGVGLVATEEDFGSSGEPPSHPALLDFLSLRFQNEYGWSTKQLLREIVLSRTYRQCAKLRPELLERDPQNRLLACGPRHRLPAETVRDQSLAFAGLLCDDSFGPPVYPYLPEGVWNPFQASDKWSTPKDGDSDRYRRSIYTYTKRSIPYPIFASFDAPSREFCTPRRLRSNTPLQALMILNDEVFQECAVGLARRMQQASDDPREQIKFGIRLVTCRDAREFEINELATLAEAVKSDEPLHGITAVASVLLNLDEVITK